LICVFRYEGVIREVIHKLKYKFAYDIAEELSNSIFNSIRFEKYIFKDAFLVPVPLSNKRKRWRGFNQAEELGKIIAATLDIKYLPAIIKPKDTPTQVEVAFNKRKSNLKEAFFVDEKYQDLIKGTKVVIFDDVFTTGSTLNEAAGVLKRFGAKEVIGFVVAA
jgi:ComF family protein